MQFTRVLLYLFLFGFVLYTVKSQEPSVTNDDNENGSDAIEEPADPDNDEDPENDGDSALAKLANITSIEEFIGLLERDGRPVEIDELISPHESEDGKHHITTGGGRMAEPDDCSPRDTTVRLPLDNSDARVVYYPRCSKVKRCGGCCTSSNLECLPAYIERESLQVLRAEVPFPGSSHLEPTGFTTVIVEKHVTCRVQCNLNANKCGPKKEFLSNVCECKCRHYQRCHPPHTWNKEECGCTCPETKVCCPRGDNCGLKFNTAICDCDVDNDPRSYISAYSNITEEELQEFLASRNMSDEIPDSSDTHAASDNHHNSESGTHTQTTPSTTTSTTTTTTTTTPTTPTTNAPDPCAAVQCPPSFLKAVNQAGQCTCRPGRNFHRHRFNGRG